MSSLRSAPRTDWAKRARAARRHVIARRSDNEKDCGISAAAASALEPVFGEPIEEWTCATCGTANECGNEVCACCGKGREQ